MGPEFLYPYLQDPATDSCSETNESIQHPPVFSFMIHFNNILPSTRKPSKWTFCLRGLRSKPCTHFACLMRATCSTYHKLWGFHGGSGLGKPDEDHHVWPLFCCSNNIFARSWLQITQFSPVSPYGCTFVSYTLSLCQYWNLLTVVTYLACSSTSFPDDRQVPKIYQSLYISYCGEIKIFRAPCKRKSSVGT